MSEVPNQISSSEQLGTVIGQENSNLFCLDYVLRHSNSIKTNTDWSKMSPQEFIETGVYKKANLELLSGFNNSFHEEQILLIKWGVIFAHVGIKPSEQTLIQHKLGTSIYASTLTEILNYYSSSVIGIKAEPFTLQQKKSVNTPNEAVCG